MEGPKSAGEPFWEPFLFGRIINTLQVGSHDGAISHYVGPGDQLHTPYDVSSIDDVYDWVDGVATT